jgi:hypothetical protein
MRVTTLPLDGLKHQHVVGIGHGAFSACLSFRLSMKPRGKRSWRAGLPMFSVLQERALGGQQDKGLLGLGVAHHCLDESDGVTAPVVEGGAVEVLSHGAGSRSMSNSFGTVFATRLMPRRANAARGTAAQTARDPREFSGREARRACEARSESSTFASPSPAAQQVIEGMADSLEISLGGCQK